MTFVRCGQALYAYGADVTKLRPAIRGREFAKITGAVAVGNSLGPLISGLLLQNFPYSVPIGVLIGCAVVTFVLVFLLHESLDPAEKPTQRFDPLRRHNTLMVLYRFMMDHKSHQNHQAPPEGQHRAPSLLPLAAVFCLCFSDLVGQGTLFLYYARYAFGWSPQLLG
jgi:MFS family permease